MSGIRKFNTQAERGAFYAQRMTFLQNATVTATGNQPVIGNKFWSWIDQDGEQIDWGLVSLSDNAYDGKEAVVAIGVDPWGFKTGGEAQEPHGLIVPARLDIRDCRLRSKRDEPLHQALTFLEPVVPQQEIQGHRSEPRQSSHHQSRGSPSCNQGA